MTASTHICKSRYKISAAHRNNRHLKIVLELILFIVLTVISLAYDSVNADVVRVLYTVGVAAIITVVILLWSIYSVSSKIDYFFIFIALAFVFSFGQSIIIVFGGSLNKTSILSINNGRISPQAVFESGMFVLKAMTAFTLGYTLFYKKRKINVKQTPGSLKAKVAFRRTGWIIAAICVIPTFYLTFKDVILLSRNVYSNTISTSVGIDKIFEFFVGFFDASLIMLIVSEKRKKCKRFLYTVIALYIIMQLFGGSRFVAFRLLILSAVIFVNRHRKIKVSNILMMALLAIVAGTVFSIVSMLRQVHLNSVSEYIEYIADNFGERNVFYSIFYEAGITQIFNAVVYTNCPANVGYCYGESVLKIFLGIVPNLGFWDVHPTGISTEIVFSPLYASFGMGSSLWSEVYWNFGTMGSYVFFVLLGGLFAKLVIGLKNATNNNNYAYQFFAYYIMFYFIISVRSDMVQIGRALLYYTAIPLILYNIILSFGTGARKKRRDVGYRAL